MAGLIYFSVFLLVFQFIKCNPIYTDAKHEEGVCLYGTVEDSVMALVQWHDNLKLLLTSVFYIVIIAFVNYSLIAVVKYGSAIHSCIIGNMRTVLLWIISVAFMGEKFNWLELLAFVLFVLIGSLIYNEVIVIPVKILSQNLEKNKNAVNEKKEIQAELMDPEK